MVDSETELEQLTPWCAVNIELGTDVTNDPSRRLECQDGCPGTQFECGKWNLVNYRGTCVDIREQLKRIALPYPHKFNPGVDGNGTNPIQKCSSTFSSYESGRIKQEKCYCLPPRDASSILTGYGLSGGKQVGEGCTKVPDIDPENIPGVEGNTPQQPTGWCYLAGVKYLRYEEKPEDHCYDDVGWSETEQKYYSAQACEAVPIDGIPNRPLSVIDTD